MATETETTQRQTTAERAADEDLIARAPAHDGVATQRDLRETERYLQNEIRASETRLGSKIDRQTWLIIGLLIAVIGCLAGILGTIIAGLVQM